MLLLYPDAVDIFVTDGSLDEHGWAIPADVLGDPVWSGLGNVQEQDPTSDPLAADGGGQGPANPRVSRLAYAYLPADAVVRRGCLLVAHDESWWVRSVAPIMDPIGGPLTVQRAIIMQEPEMPEVVVDP